jgi:choice-of-anchor B domain-containing protein
MLSFVVFALLAVAHGEIMAKVQEPAPCDEPRMPRVMLEKYEHRLNCWTSGECQRIQASTETHSGAMVKCVNGNAAGYDCDKVDLMANLNFVQLGCSQPGATVAEGNDVWGAVVKDPAGVEHPVVIAGCTTGVSFVDILDPVNPVVLGYLPSSARSSTWRDMKVYQGVAYIVSEARGHGMQVFNLARLFQAGAARGPSNILTADYVYRDQMGTSTQQSTHNLAINEESGYAYLVGCRTFSGGLLMVNLKNNPLLPTFAGSYAGDGYTHDAQCVNYINEYPDREYVGREICFAFNEDTFTIVDVTNKTNPVMLSRNGYNGVDYCHQGWATPDMYYLLHDDELDESDRKTPDGSQNTFTYVWDISDLNFPQQLATKNFKSPATAIDHNQYILGKCSYQANYAAGLRVLGINHDENDNLANLAQVAYFDVDPDHATAQFYGSWSVFADFPEVNQNADMDNVIVVQSIERGLFVLRLDKLALGCL